MKKAVSIITSCYGGEKYLNAFFDSYKNQTIFKDCELVFVHNDPSGLELDIVNNFKTKYANQINHIIVDREPISVSMNRAILASSSDVLINRDIDDFRTENSLELQYNTLNDNNNIFCSYGDFIIINTFGDRIGKYIKPIEFDKYKFVESMHCGPFRARKKEIHEKVGYFDEQLKSGADYDLMLRIAYAYEIKKTHGLLGYYLNANTGLSTGSDKFVSLQELELKVINTRYHIYHKIDYLIDYNYDIYDSKRIKNDGKLIPMNKIIASFMFNRNMNSVLQSIYFTIKQLFLRTAKYFYIKYMK